MKKILALLVMCLGVSAPAWADSAFNPTNKSLLKIVLVLKGTLELLMQQKLQRMAIRSCLRIKVRLPSIHIFTKILALIQSRTSSRSRAGLSNRLCWWRILT